MADQTILQRLTEVIVDVSGCNEAQVTHEAAFESIGFDELDMVELFMAVEEEFGVEIWEEHEDNLKTVGELLAYIEKALAS